MYSEELNKFIELILADDEISDKERSVLHKKAISEGIDPDEIDIVVDGMLAKKKRERASKAQPVSSPATPNPTIKHGDVNKCPSCGAVIVAGSVKCEDCGYVFRNITAISSRQKLSDLVAEINQRDFTTSGLTGFLGLDLMKEERRDKARASAIYNFPVPTSKEDLLEFILFLAPQNDKRMIDNDQKETVKAYRMKYKECLTKAEIFFADDPQFQKILHPEPKKSVFGKLFGKK